MIIAVCFTWKHCSWCMRQFINPSDVCGYCSEECEKKHKAGASMIVRRNANEVDQCIL